MMHHKILNEEEFFGEFYVDYFQLLSKQHMC